MTNIKAIWLSQQISKANQKKITEIIKTEVNWRNTQQKIDEIAEKLNDRVRGWINSYGLYGKRELRKTLLRLERRLLKWTQKKYKLTSIRKGIAKLLSIKREKPAMFYHWTNGYC